MSSRIKSRTMHARCAERSFPENLRYDRIAPWPDSLSKSKKRLCDLKEIDQAPDFLYLYFSVKKCNQLHS